MRLSFVQPAVLWLLLLLAPLASLALVTQRRVATWRRATSLVLRAAIFTALVFALAGAQWVRPASSTTTIFVVDSSDSVAPDARARAEAYVQAAMGEMPAGDRAGVIVFGAEPLVERAPSDSRQLPRLLAAPPTSYTDIQRALELALAILPSETRKRIVLLSDGGENRGRATAITTAAAANNVQIDTVPLLGPPPADDVAVEAIEAPALVRTNQPIRLVIQARASTTATARLQLLRDRQPILDTTVDLVAGLNRLPITVPDTPPGFHAWEVRIQAPEDGVAANNVAFGFSAVRGLPRVAVVEGAPGRGANLVTALTAAKLDVVTLLPAALPTTLLGLDAFDAIALVDVPYHSLPKAAAKLLPAYVRELGRGLLMVGGADSFAAGGYLNTPVEAALPVSMRTRGVQIRPDVALVLVIDRSGSMQGEKLDLAREGAAQAYSALNDQDQIGVVVFDSEADWAVKLQRRPPGDEFLGALGNVGIGGGTDLRPGLEQAATALEAADARIKHVVLLTDGQADRNYDDVVERLKQGGITLSTVGVGEDYDKHLQDIAPVTGGRFYEALSFQDIPTLFFDETLRISRRGIVERDFTPTLTFPGAAMRDIASVPPLHGYNATTPKETAQVVLVSDDGDPVLAQWQYGLGRAAAWTSDMKGQWARDWVAWESFGRFAAQLVGSLVPPPAPAGLEATTAIEGPSLVVSLRADDVTGQPQSGLRAVGRVIAPDGRVIEVPMIEVQAGRYRGTLALPDAGVYQTQVIATGNNGQMLGVAQTGAVVPPSAEYLLREGNPGLLQALAEATNGRYDPQMADIWQRPTEATRLATPVHWPLLWLVALLWPLDIAVRRLLFSLPLLHKVLRQKGTERQPAAAGGDLARARARVRTLRVPGDAGNTPATPPASASQPPPSPSHPQSNSSSWDWRSTRRSRVERPSERKREQ